MRRRMNRDGRFSAKTMSEPNQPDKTPGGSTKGGEWDSVTDKELDQALSKAANLAEELVDQLGRPESVDAPTANPLDDKRSDFDAELGQLSELTRAASEQLQEAPPEPSAVPDFMSEFMEPPSETPAEPEPIADGTFGDDLAAAPAHVSAAVDSAPKGVVGGVINIALPAGKLRKQAEAERDKAATHAATTNRRGLVEKALNPIAATLEAVDRPFARLNNRSRMIAGWLGIALLLASGVLLYLRLG